MRGWLAAGFELANHLYGRPVQAVAVDVLNTRLVEVKMKCGPENFFRINQDIVPRTNSKEMP